VSLRRVTHSKEQGTIMCICIPGQVSAITDAANRIALVKVGDSTRQVSLACLVDDTHAVESFVSAWVLVQHGFAMSRIDEAEAKQTLELLAALADIEPALAAQRESSF